MAYTQYGELDRAIEGYKEIIQYADNNNIADAHLTNMSYASTGEIYYKIGNYEKANYYIQEALERWKRVQHYEYLGMSYYNIIRNLIMQNKNQEAQDIFTDLKELRDRVIANAEHDDEYLNRVYSLAEAFILKSSPRMMNKAKAQIIYDNILKDEKLQIYYRLDILKYQCEIFLSELRSEPSEEVYKEAKQLILELQTLSERENLMLSQVETHILLSRFALIENDFEKVSYTLQEAENVVKKYNLVALQKIIEREKILLDEQFRIHSDLVSKNADLQERVKASKIEEYLQFALKQKVDT